MTGSMQMLLAGGSGPINDFGGTLAAEDTTVPYSDSATLRLENTGTITKEAGPTITQNTIGSAWLNYGAVSGWSVKATVVGGALTAGTTGSWLDLTTSRSWNVANNASANVDLAFSNDGGTTTIKTVRVYLSASNLL